MKQGITRSANCDVNRADHITIALVATVTEGPSRRPSKNRSSVPWLDFQRMNSPFRIVVPSLWLSLSLSICENWRYRGVFSPCWVKSARKSPKGTHSCTLCKRTFSPSSSSSSSFSSFTVLQTEAFSAICFRWTRPSTKWAFWLHLFYNFQVNVNCLYSKQVLSTAKCVFFGFPPSYRTPLGSHWFMLSCVGQ